jgi:arylsulfatase
VNPLRSAYIARWFAFILLLGATTLHAAAPRPNIIVILADDVGYSDVGCFGGEIQTPNLDALAKNGLRFTQFYNTARCCPTRAALLTGLYSHQAGVGHMIDDRGHDGYRGELNQRCVTIAEALRPAGYSTYMAGKWHVTLNSHVKPDAPKDSWPMRRGFDRFYWHDCRRGELFRSRRCSHATTPCLTAFSDPEYKPAALLLHLMR